MSLQDDISGLKWKRPGKCESGHCPEAAVFSNGMIGIRSTAEPNKVTWLDKGEWDAMVDEMRSAKPFGIVC